ncbi:MAG TPA: AI-2E family transporter, partial [Campylobacterales bacterium]|nr:AI-2E family transporter [Campylobacterales bacterium]
KINSLLIFFAILAGISTYGFWGIIIGPAVTALFISLLKIYDTLKRSQQNVIEEIKS